MNHSYRKIGLLYLGAFFLAFHYYVVIYIDSSFLGRYISESKIGILYVIAAALTIFFLYKLPSIFKRRGVMTATLTFSLLEIAALLGLATVHSPVALAFLFVIHLSLPSLLLYCLDVFLERLSPPENTGLIRALYMTVMNAVCVVSPILSGYIITHASYQTVYLLSSIFLVGFFIVIACSCRKIKDRYSTLSIRLTLHDLQKNRDLRDIISINFLLQFFYTIMVVYTPLYLYHHLGFSWESIGIIFTIMLLPFIIFELPLGRLADTRFGEKEILAAGFVIMAFATFAISFFSSPAIWMWAALLFTTRIGASFVEIASDTYFFKKVTSHDTDLISFYRGMIPLAAIVAPLVVSALLLAIDLRFVFAVLGIILLLGIVASLELRDTR